MGPSWGLFGKVFGPQAIENQSPWCLWAGQEPIPNYFFGPQRAPRALQERSKRPPRGLRAAKTAPRALQEAPRGPRIDFRTVFETFGGPFPSRFGDILNAESGAESREQSKKQTTKRLHKVYPFQVVLEPSRMQKAEQRAESRAKSKPPCQSGAHRIGGTGRTAPAIL